MKKEDILNYNGVLLIILVLTLIFYYLNIFSQDTNKWILIVVASAATIPVVIKVFMSFKNKKLTVDLLAIIALIFSLIAGELVSAIFINLMLTSARILARYTEDRTRHAIKSLLKLRPKTAMIEKNGKVIEILLSQVKKGDLVVVELGETIPVDGIIVRNSAAINQASLTGESIPVTKAKGDKVFSSTTIISGNIVIRVEKVGKETTLEKIIDLVEKAQENKPKINTTADKFANLYILFTIIGSILLYFILGNIGLVLAVLLVTCADDVAIAIPLAYLASIGYAAKRGVIIKGGNFLEAISQAKVFIADKTGTLTYGKLNVKGVFIFNPAKKKQFFEIAGMISLLSTHPSARAILEYVKNKGVIINEPEKFKEYSGRGGAGIYKNKKIAIGKLSFFKELKIKISEEHLGNIKSSEEKCLNTTLIGYDNKIIGFFALEDELRPKVRETIAKLKELGIEKTIMLTGDNEKIAEKIAKESGVDEFHANLLPEGKIECVKKYLNKKYKVIMVGDGINDAAALGLADISIAMGVIGSDTAIEVADIALMEDDISKIPEIIRLSKTTNKISYQDIGIWAITNIAGLALVFTGIIHPVGAATYNFVTDFVPIINSIRLFSAHLRK